MDLYEWAEGAWYAEMARLGRELYDVLQVGGAPAGTIGRLIYGMEIRATDALGENSFRLPRLSPPQDLVRAHLSGNLEHNPGPPLRPLPGQTDDHNEFADVPDWYGTTT